MTTDPDRARDLRRRRMHERQAGIFGLLLAGLAVAGIGSAAVFSGAVDLPFLARDFSTASPTPGVGSIVPCPPTGALPVAVGEVTVNVYNGSNASGLAGSTATALTERGFAVATVANATLRLGDAARLSFGASGVAAAYTLAAHLEDPVMVLDERQDATVDLIVGERFNDLVPADEVTLDPALELVGAAGCRPIDEVVPAPAPSVASSSEPGAEDVPADEEPVEGEVVVEGE